MKIARFVAHEITQKYLGNLFSSSYWLDTWLNEGFTMFFQTYVIDKVILYLNNLNNKTLYITK